MIFLPRSTLKSLKRLVETHRSLEMKREILCYHRTHIIVMMSCRVFSRKVWWRGTGQCFLPRTLVAHLSPGGKDRETRKGCPKGVREK